MSKILKKKKKKHKGFSLIFLGSFPDVLDIVWCNTALVFQLGHRSYVSSEEIPWGMHKKEGTKHSEPEELGMVRRNSSFWGLHVTCLTTISPGRLFGVSWEWAGVVDVQAVIGSSRLPIFRFVSCPSLVCVQLGFGMKTRCLGCSLSLSTSHNGNSQRACSLALKHTLLSQILAFSPLDRWTEANESSALIPGATDANQVKYCWPF